MKNTYLLFLFLGIIMHGHGQILSEDFEIGLPEDYTTGTVNLASGDWSGTNFSRESESHSGSYSCKLRNVTGSNIISPVIPSDGVRTVTLWATKTTSGAGSALQIRLSEDGGAFNKVGSTLVLEQDVFNEYTVDINSTSPNIQIQFYRTEGTVFIDDVLIVFANATMPNAPTLFTVEAASSSQIDLSWTENEEEDMVLLAWNSSDIFGTPVNGTSYAVGDAIPGGGNVLQYATTDSYQHMGLAANTPYYYRIWSYDGSEYSLGKSEHTNTEAIPSELELIITEIMQNPAAVSDINGEYFEIYNFGNVTVDINGFVIKDSETNSHTIAHGRELNIAPGAFLILARNIIPSENGGILADYEFSDYALGNSEDAIIFLEPDGTTEIDRVAYGNNPSWPDPVGASMIFIGTSSDDNNIGSNWIESRVREKGFDDSETDLGSPGTNGLYQNLISTTTWTGTGNWSEGNGPESSNWSHGSPGHAVDVIIDGSVNVNLEVSHFAECHDLTINTAKSVNIEVGKALTIHGDYTNHSGTMTIRSDVNGEGSLIIDGAMNGDMQIEKFIAPYTENEDGWHLLSIPRTASFDIGESDFLPTEHEDDLYKWNEATYQWENYFGLASPAFNLEPGMGYLVAYENQETIKEFSGSMNHQDFTFSHLENTMHSADPSENGWHLLGNPFTSAIKWKDGHWALDQIGSIAKVYDESMGNYFPIEANDPIPSAQGFFVQVNAGETGSLTIPLASRFHNDTKWYKNTAPSAQTLELKVSGGMNSFYDITKIRFNDLATEYFDSDFDSHKIYGMPSAPQLYSLTESEKYSINTMPYQQEEKTLPLSFRAGTNGRFTIEVVAYTIASEGKNYLEDLLLNQWINLDLTTSYTFQSTTEDNANRFLLHFNGVTAVEELSEEHAPQVYAVEEVIYINHAQDLDADIFIYATNGQLVGQAQMSKESMKRVSVNGSTGIYLVTIQAEDAVYTKKVFVK